MARSFVDLWENRVFPILLANHQHQRFALTALTHYARARAGVPSAVQVLAGDEMLLDARFASRGPERLRHCGGRQQRGEQGEPEFHGVDLRDGSGARLLVDVVFEVA